LYFLQEIGNYVTRTNRKIDSMQMGIRMMLRYVSMYEALVGVHDARSTLRILTEDIDSKNDERISAALYYVCDFIRSASEQPAARELARLIIEAAFEKIEWRYWHGAKEGISLPRLGFSRESILEFVGLKGSRIAAERGRDHEAILVVNFDRIFNELARARKPRISVAGREPNLSGQTSFRWPLAAFTEGMNATERTRVESVLKSGLF
jgi:hypothetical protein